MRHRFVLRLAGAALLVTATASAQSIEAGFTVGNGQRGSEGALIRAEARLVAGVQVGLLLENRLETAVRLVWLDLPSTRARATYYHGCEMTPEGGCRPAAGFEVIARGTSPRLFASGQVLYHFRRGSQWRPFAGVGFGAMRDSEEGTCDRSDCTLLMPGLQSVLGRRTRWYSDPLIPVAGVAVTVGEHVAIRGGVQFHRPLGEELSLFETFTTIGYRF